MLAQEVKSKAQKLCIVAARGLAHDAVLLGLFRGRASEWKTKSARGYLGVKKGERGVRTVDGLFCDAEEWERERGGLGRKRGGVRL